MSKILLSTASKFNRYGLSRVVASRLRETGKEIHRIEKARLQGTNGLETIKPYPKYSP